MSETLTKAEREGWRMYCDSPQRRPPEREFTCADMRRALATIDAMERALSMTKRERDAALAEVERLKCGGCEVHERVTREMLAALTQRTAELRASETKVEKLAALCREVIAEHYNAGAETQKFRDRLSAILAPSEAMHGNLGYPECDAAPAAATEEGAREGCPNCGAMYLVGAPEQCPFCAETINVWRVGRKLGRTLYVDDECVGMFDTPELAAQVVERMNAPPIDAQVVERVCEAVAKWIADWLNVVAQLAPDEGPARRQARVDTISALAEEARCGKCRPDIRARITAALTEGK